MNSAYTDRYISTQQVSLISDNNRNPKKEQFEQTFAKFQNLQNYQSNEQLQRSQSNPRSALTQQKQQQQNNLQPLQNQENYNSQTGRKSILEETNDFLMEHFTPNRSKITQSIQQSTDVPQPQTISPITKLANESSINGYQEEHSILQQSDIVNPQPSTQKQAPPATLKDKFEKLSKKAQQNNELNNSRMPLQNNKLFENILNQLPKFIEQYTDGSTYEGQMQNGVRQGKGKYNYGKGGYYDGEWNMGNMDGYGKLFFSSGKLAYEGEWVNSKYQGKGVQFNEKPTFSDKYSLNIDKNDVNKENNFDKISGEWIKYQGDFKEDLWDGIGKLFFSNGEEFYGEFRKDKIQGKGSYYTRKGEIIMGVWDNNKLVKTL